MKKIIVPVILAILVSVNAAYANKIVGILEPFLVTTIKAQVAGEIKQINYKIGDKIKKGQTILKIDNTDYSLLHQLAVENQKLSKESFVFAKKDYARYANLLKTNSITPQVYDTKKKDYKTAIFQKNIAIIATRQAKVNLDRATIKSPYEAIISNKYVEIGDYINVGDNLVEIINNSTLKAVFYVLPDDYETYEPSKVVNLSIPSLNNKKITGTVHLISPTITGTNSGYRMEVLIDNKDAKIKSNFDINLLIDNKLNTNE